MDRSIKDTKVLGNYISLVNVYVSNHYSASIAFLFFGYGGDCLLVGFVAQVGKRDDMDRMLYALE